ncbi:type 1 fimbria pilin [Pantoea alhagi]|uniref:fimbrial protein n=1 Tax=Mixta sp. BE291 TaxID=3158787 RepID=UPI0028567EB9|nr:type 1 fimbria pilin [Pantoea alhagi]
MVVIKVMCRLAMAFFMWLMIMPGISQAACSLAQPLEFYLPDIVLTPSQKGTPGTILYSYRTSLPGISYSCGTNVYSTWRSSYVRSGFIKTSINNVYSTGIAGVGVRIKWPESRGTNAWVPGSYQCQGTCTEPSDTLLIEFVQTGNSQSGIITPGLLMEVKVSPDSDPTQGVTLLRLHNNNIRVQIRSCSIIATSNHIELGDYFLPDVKKTGFTAPKREFSITLDCPNPSTAQIQFDGITAWGQDPSLLKNQGDAKYVYVKLHNKYAACAKCYRDLRLNELTDFGSAAPFQGTRKVNYAAEMYFDDANRDKITAGRVEASMVFTLTIN